MRSLFPFFLAAFAFCAGCSKSAQNHVHCDNLVTDTLGTGDTAWVFAPTAFTPNGDFRNDIYRIVAKGISEITVTVYDENNNIVFNSPSITPGGIGVTDAWRPTVTSNTYRKYYFRVQATTNRNYKIGICGDLYILNCMPANADRSRFIFEDQLKTDGTLAETTENLSNRICN